MRASVTHLLLNRSDPLPIHAQIKNHIKSQILSGQLPTGRRLPTVKSLMHQFGASVNTIQRVLRDLQTEGLVKGKRGRGTFVAGAAPSHARAAGELWVDSLRRVFAEESIRVQNDFQRVVPNGKVVIRDLDADVLELTDDNLPLYADELLDIGDVIEEAYGRSRNDPDLFAPLQIAGQNLLMPIIVNPDVVLCNLDAFERAGAPLPPSDWTWDDFFNTARAVTRPQDDQYALLAPKLWLLYLTRVWQAGGAVLSEDGAHARADSDICLQVSEEFRALRPYCRPPGPGREGPAGGTIEQFLSGKIALTSGSVWMPAHLASQNKVRWTALPFPRGQVVTGYKSVFGYGVRKSSPVPELAKAFLRVAAQWEKWPDRQQYVNGLNLHADLERDDAVERAYRQMARCGRTMLSDVRPECRTAAQADALKVLASAIPKVVQTDEPVISIMGHARDSMNALLGEPADSLRWLPESG